MAQVPQHLIDEAAKRGIVPGAMVRSPFSKAVFTVPNSGQWWMSADDMLSGPCDNGNRHLFESEDGWATVITPAPAKEEEGLKEGDAVRSTLAMKNAIIEIAAEIGMPLSPLVKCHDELTSVGLFYGAIGSLSPQDLYNTVKRWYTPEAFIAKMRITAAKPNPIKIGNDVVKFNTGSITVGCTTIDNATVKAIAQKLID